VRWPLSRYGVAILCVAPTVSVALLLRPAVMVAGQLSLVAIVITGWVCGLRPALLAWGLTTLAFAYFFTPTLDSFRIDLAETPRLAIFALLGLFMATMSAARRRAEDSLEKAREGLEARVRARTADLERSNARLQAAVAEVGAAQVERQGTCGCSKASIASIGRFKLRTTSSR
jgi:K+-sensing histidine kinase KdpD